MSKTEAAVVPGSLRAIIGREAQAAALAREAQSAGKFRPVPLELLDDNPWQPRIQMDEGRLAELTASIAEHGLLQPISVRPTEAGRLQIIAGHRRATAFRRLLAKTEGAVENEDTRAKFSTIWAEVKPDVDDNQMERYALVENLQREEMTLLDAAVAIEKMRTRQGLSAEEVADVMKLPLDRVRRLITLCGAPLAIRTACGQGVMVAVLGEDGEPRKTDSGKEKHEHRRLDLAAALELQKLYKHYEKATDTKRASERLDNLIRKVLSKGWTTDEVVRFVRAAKQGNASADVAADAPKASALELAQRHLDACLKAASAAPPEVVMAVRERLLAAAEALRA